MFISSSFFCGLEFWSVKHTSIYQNSDLKVYKIIKFLGEKISNNWLNNLLGKNVYKTLEVCW